MCGKNAASHGHEDVVSRSLKTDRISISATISICLPNDLAKDVGR